MGEETGNGAAKRWHVIECFNGRDGDVYGRLAAMGFEVWRPVVAVRSSARWKGKALASPTRRTVYAPLFGRYLFLHVAMSDSVFGAVIEQPGVHSWLCWAGSDDPAAVPDELIAHYREIKDHPVSAIVYSKGDRVRILAGPFVNHQAVVEGVDSRGGLVVLLDIFGRPTPLPTPVGLVELVEQGRRPPIKRDDAQRQRKRA